MIVAQIAGNIEEVSQPTQAQCQFDTQSIGNRPRKEADDAESRVKGNVGVVGCTGIKLSSSSKASDGVEHAGAHETDEGDERELEGGRGIGGDCDGPEPEWSIFPSCGKLGVTALVPGGRGARFGHRGLDGGDCRFFGLSG